MNISRRIGTKMIVLLLTTFFIVLGTFLVVVYFQTTALSDKKAVTLVENAAENHSNSIQVAFSQVDSLLVGLKTAAEQYDSIPILGRRDFLDNLLTGVMIDDTNDLIAAWASFELDTLDANDRAFANSLTTDATGRYATYVYRSGNRVEKTVLVGYDTEDFYQTPFRSGVPHVTDPYEYEMDGRKVSIITIGYPIRNQFNTVIGVIGVNYSLTRLNALNNNVQLFDTGFGKLVTDKYEVVAHADFTKVGTKDVDLNNPELGPRIKQALEAGEIFTEKIYSPTLGEYSYKSYTTMSLGNANKNWIYAVIVSEKEVMKDTNTMIGTVATIAIVGLIIATLIIIVLARSISRPIKSMSDVTEKIAAGDLTVTVPDKFKNKKDEIGVLARDVEKMRDELLNTVSGITNGVDSINTQMESIHAAISELNNSITDTSASTEELSAGMEETGASAEELNATAVEIEQEVEQINAKAEEGAGRSNEIHKRANELNKSINTSIQSSNKVFKEIEGHLETALEESKAVDEINALADAILEITSQTTLLALNASIEAARAGEAGRGFAVVANEIGSLAEHSKNTVSQIQTVTKTVMNAVTLLSKSANELLNFVSGDIMKKFEEMLEASKSYSSDATYISGMTKELNDIAHKLQESTKVLLRAINEVSNAAQEGAGTTQRIAEETNEIADNVSVVADSMDAAGHTFDKLHDMVKVFKVK